MFRFLTCTWVGGYKSTVELWQDYCALHRPLAPDNLILSSVLVYKKDHINVVLLSDAMIVVRDVLGPRLVPQQKGGEGSCVRRAEMGGSPIAFSELIVSLRLSPCTPKRLHIHGLSNKLHSLFWSVPVHPSCSNNGGVSGHMSLMLFSSSLKREKGIARSCSPGFGTERVVEWREGENSLSKYRQGLEVTKGKKCSLLGCKNCI